MKSDDILCDRYIYDGKHLKHSIATLPHVRTHQNLIRIKSKMYFYEINFSDIAIKVKNDTE